MEETTKNTQKNELNQEEGTVSDLEECFYDDYRDQNQAEIDEIINNTTPVMSGGSSAADDEKTKKSYGTIKKTNFLSEVVGNLTLEDEETGIVTKFSLELGAISRTPIVVNENNGKSLSLTWEDLVNMAIDAGILNDEVGEIKNASSD